MTDETLRSRTFTWDDPTLWSTAQQELSGLQFIGQIADGTLPPPPIARLMNFRFHEVAEGKVVAVVTPAEFHYNPIGSVHGGLAATLLDTVMGCAIHTALPHGMGYTTLELKVNYVRAMTTRTGEVQAIGTVIHRGNRVATAEGKIIDSQGKLYAHGTTTCLVLSQRGE